MEKNEPEKTVKRVASDISKEIVQHLQQHGSSPATPKLQLLKWATHESPLTIGKSASSFVA
jgi:hypothetical protein